MVAHDRSSGTSDDRFPSPAAIGALRAALVAHLAGRGAESGVRLVIERLTREARDRELHAEQVLVAVKGVWHDMPEVRALPSAAERQRVLDRLVKLCIDIFYQG